MNYNDQVTMLRDLPQLEEMVPTPDRGHMGAPSEESLRKALRQNHQPLPQSGMYTETGAPYSPLQQRQRTIYEPQNGPLAPSAGAFYKNAYHPMEIETYDGVKANGPTCLDINGHVTNCPICKRFYSSSERLIYIIALIILAVISLLLFKRVLDDSRR